MPLVLPAVEAGAVTNLEDSTLDALAEQARKRRPLPADLIEALVSGYRALQSRVGTLEREQQEVRKMFGVRPEEPLVDRVAEKIFEIGRAYQAVEEKAKLQETRGRKRGRGGQGKGKEGRKVKLGPRVKPAEDVPEPEGADQE